MLGRNRLLKERLQEYEKTPQIGAQQDLIQDRYYKEACREALMICSDPRADIYDISEGSFSRLKAGWMNWGEDARTNLFRLVQEYSSLALRKLPRKFDVQDWLTPQYPSLFEDVASGEQRATLIAIMDLDDKDRRVFEARRVYGWTVSRTAEAFDIKRNTIGSTTTRIERALDSRPGTSVSEVRALFDTYLTGGGI